MKYKPKFKNPPWGKQNKAIKTNIKKEEKPSDNFRKYYETKNENESNYSGTDSGWGFIN